MALKVPLERWADYVKVSRVKRFRDGSKGFAFFAKAALARRRRLVALSFFVHALQEFLEFRFLFGSEKRADLVAPFLPRLFHLRIRLVVDRFVLPMQLRKRFIELLPLIVRQAQFLGQLLDFLRASLRFT